MTPPIPRAWFGLAFFFGIVFIIGRAVYFNLYIGNPDKRGPGVLISLLATAVLVIGSVIGALVSLS